MFKEPFIKPFAGLLKHKGKECGFLLTLKGGKARRFSTAVRWVFSSILKRTLYPHFKGQQLDSLWVRFGPLTSTCFLPISTVASPERKDWYQKSNSYCDGEICFDYYLWLLFISAISYISHCSEMPHDGILGICKICLSIVLLWDLHSVYALEPQLSGLH